MRCAARMRKTSFDLFNFNSESFRSSSIHRIPGNFSAHTHTHTQRANNKIGRSLASPTQHTASTQCLRSVFVTCNNLIVTSLIDMFVYHPVHSVNGFLFFRCSFGFHIICDCFSAALSVLALSSVCRHLLVVLFTHSPLVLSFSLSTRLSHSGFSISFLYCFFFSIKSSSFPSSSS